MIPSFGTTVIECLSLRFLHRVVGERCAYFLACAILKVICPLLSRNRMVGAYGCDSSNASSL